MSEPKLLTAHIVEPDDDSVLNEGLRRVEQQITDRKRELKQLEGMVAVAASKLRALHVALSVFFGGTAQEPGSDSPADAYQPPNAAAWATWKQRLPEPTGRIIDALLVQPLTQTQIATQARIHTSNVSKYMAPLRNNSLLEQDGSRWRLKRI